MDKKKLKKSEERDYKIDSLEIETGTKPNDIATMETFIQEINKYYKLSEHVLNAFLDITSERVIRKGQFFIHQGDIPRTTFFIQKGLMSYYNISENGDSIIKKFFYEKSFVSVPASYITQTPSLFSIEALEDVHIIEYSSYEYYKLIKQYPEMAFFHINYIERNWIIAKEPLEISLKYRTAKMRYFNFLDEYKPILHRLKQHHIASFLGITPTQLSRIKRDL